jgi:steroid 5-alpha reductase family enzyme
VAAIVALKALGYWVFRGSNSQKNTFRQNPKHPDVRHLETIKTASGRRLLVSGWWGVARHINYFGDWLMAYVSQLMPCMGLYAERN